MDVKVVIPQDLRRYLLDDCDFVTRQKQLVPLPKPDALTVRAITTKYENYKEANTDDAKIVGLAKEMCRGLNEYFNVLLGSQLLYKFERGQYAELLKNNVGKQLCDLYGAEHLLRMFVKIGRALPYSYLDETSMEFVLAQLHDFLDFVMKNSEDLFEAEYDNSTPEYQRAATAAV